MDWDVDVWLDVEVRVEIGIGALWMFEPLTGVSNNTLFDTLLLLLLLVSLIIVMADGGLVELRRVDMGTLMNMRSSI